jgi:hypothetical protein
LWLLYIFSEQHAVLQGIAKDEEDLKLTLRAIRKTISDGEGELKGFRSTTADDVLRFFRNDQREQIKKLLSAISGQATLFHYPPVGPIGQHLAISDERCSGPSLHVFKHFGLHVGNAFDMPSSKEFFRSCLCNVHAGGRWQFKPRLAHCLESSSCITIMMLM